MTLLLLADPAIWAADVAAEARALGIGPPVVIGSAQDAIVHIAGGSLVSYLLLQPDCAGSLRDALIEMTAGEADCPTRLIVIGDSGHAFAIPGAIRADGAPGWLGRAIRTQTPPRDISPLNDAELLDALGSGCLRASYQPIVSLSTRAPVGLEALARLHHPQRGTLAPSMFVPHAEASGMGWTLFRLLTAIILKDWNVHAMERLDVPLGLNIAVDEILRPDLPAWLAAQCAAADMPPSMLVLEMTETQPVQDTAALRVAASRLSALGFALMIDDVGPGLRDPADLLDLKFAGMKIDKVLVNAAASSAEAREVLDRLLDRAREAGLTTIAEGVEDVATWNHVRAMGFDRVQGFHAGRPLPAAAVASWHRAWTEPPPLPRPPVMPQRTLRL